ncbi:YigZ family protein [Nanchangia anserum]|uniref:YigZ family protein n=1 Tax=Nanchangia anserum TaxID=2692125 RepID=A0A8I0GC78_9ACTO|nr:YigZ family protein [Nanchangia anserum]MBD3688878.1 YigZ family protein [Nanchangia anserum]QOX81145.1 YigZ family protein [Nanchangia anserum]
MRTLATSTPARAELTIKRSRFIAHLQRVPTEEDARAVIATIRKAEADARHNCTAFRIRAEHGVISRSSDDGEPAGTAGMPMLQTLTGGDLVDVVAVVTRYFGGIKLGTGGLVRAYSDAVAEAISAANLVELRSLTLTRLRTPLPHGGALEASLREAGALIVDTAWDTDMGLSVAATPAETQRWIGLAREVTRGELTATPMGSHIVEVPVR